MLSDSVPPLVNTISLGEHPIDAATVSLAPSTARRVPWDSSYGLDGFPYLSLKYGSIASTTRGSVGVVALWSM